MAVSSTPRTTDRPRSASTLARTLRSYPRRNPMTFWYLLLIAAGLLVLGTIPGPTADRFKIAISTNPHNLAHDPVFVLLVSPLVSATDSSVLSQVLTIGVGVGVCMAALERRIGRLRTLAVFVLGNTLATAVATSVAAAAIHSARYPAQWWNGYDYGISYGVLAVAAAVTPLVPRGLRVLWALFVLVYPFESSQWFGLLPNFDTIGHLTAACFGLVAGPVMIKQPAGTDPQ